MATTTPNFGWPVPTSTDLVKDGATAIEALGDGIDTSMVDLKGGLTGQVLAKATNADMDFTWVTSDDANAIQNTIVDAKGDLISATGSDVPARLAVGANGEILVADSSTTTGLRYQATKGRNVCYNSGFQVWQRGTSFTVPTAGGEYTADRWYAAFSAIAGRTLSRQTGTAQFPYFMRVARDSGNSATNALLIGQSWEIADATPYAGQTVTISYYARKGANYSATSDGLAFSFYTGTSSTEANRITTAYASGDTVLLSATTTLTSTLTRYSHTVTLAAGVTQFALRFTFTPTGTAGAADYYEITGLQVEVGSTPTTWNTLGTTFQGELAACQRYYWNWKSGNSLTMGIGRYTTATEMGIYTMFPVTMRIAPSLVATTGTNYYSIGSDGFNSFTIFQQDTSSAWLYNLSEVSGTGGNTDRVFTNNAAASVSFSAEL
jgi:hypothetical protein